MIIKKLLYKLLNKFDYSLIKNKDLISFKLDDFKNFLKEDNSISIHDDSKNFSVVHLNNIYKNENLISYISKNFSKSNSQLFQDLFVDYILKKENGFYCEVGAFDGKKLSNTLYLEKNRGWSGILCEPDKRYTDTIRKNRTNNILVTEPIFSKENIEVIFTELSHGRSGIDKNSITEKSYALKTSTLNKVLEENLNNKKINYLSIDTEGTEYEIIKGLDFDRFYPEIITIEHNYDKEKREKIYKLLKNKKYDRYFKSISRFDDWYVRPHD